MKNKLIYAIAAITITLISCSKDEQLEIQPTVSATRSGARVVSTTNACPNSIRLTGNSNDGNKVQAIFDKDNAPAFVRVVVNGVVTTDVSALAGNSGQWNSTDKYLTTDLGLQLLDSAGHVTCNCRYNTDAEMVSASPAHTVEEIEFVVEHVRRD